MSLTYSKVGKKKLEKKWKILLPIYGVAFLLLGVVPSVLIDIYYVTHATNYDPSKLGTMISLCAVTDIAIWGCFALLMVFVTAISLLVIQGVRAVKDAVGRGKKGE